ncbi:MAG TPA: glycosyltransferase family 1 protein [bacterium]|nr:glycosyltransferase family 1 protein [bacterium]HPN30014.1 glycosyltransferase family 1 protein [bacterium]
MSLKFTIDATYTLAQKTGIGYFVEGLIAGLKKINSTDDFSLFYNCIFPEKYGVISPSQNNFKNHILRIPRRFLMNFWNSNWFPNDLFLPKSDVFVCTGLHLPNNLKSKIVSIIYDVSFKIDDFTYSMREKNQIDSLIKKILKNSDFIFTCSESTKTDLIKYYDYPESKIGILYGSLTEIDVNKNNLTLTEEFVCRISEKNFSETGLKTGFSKNTNYFLFIGAIEKRKNLGIICEALKNRGLDLNGDNFKIIIAGKKSNDFKDFFQKITDYGLTDKFIFTGYVSEIEKYTLLNNCLGTLYPSVYEGFGYPVLESFYFSKPVITTRRGSIPELAGEAAFYIEPFNPEDLLEKMTLIYKNKNCLEKIFPSKKFNSQLEKFSWEKSALKFIETIKSKVCSNTITES